MFQDDLNKALDNLLEQLISNGDITSMDSPEEMKRILLSLICDKNHRPVEVSEEQWRNYCVHCVQSTIEGYQKESRKPLVQ